MTTHPLNPARSEQGVALVIVLLLLAVMTGLTTALVVSGQTEIALASNEVSYAGTRAAAEAGLNRAIEQIIADTTTVLLAGADGLVDAGNPAAAVNADNGRVPVIGNGPFAIGTQYSYQFQILDDDDPSLYPTALTGPQLAQMGEDGSAYTSGNSRLILRATGLGPKGTTVILSRVLQSVTVLGIPPTTTTILSNPAILINGDLTMNGAVKVLGSKGNVHSNGNVTKSGAGGQVSGDLTATGTLTTGSFQADGAMAGGMPPITIPEIKAADYKGLADWILTSTGTQVRASDGAICGGAGPTCPTGWSSSLNLVTGTRTWSASGAAPQSGTYYAEGPVTIHGTGKPTLTSLSIIAEGSITVTGNGKFQPANTAKIQFVTNGDLDMNADVYNEAINIDGQIMIREQMKIHGNAEFQGRVMVQDLNGATNAYNAITNPHGRRGSSTLTANSLDGNVTLTYNGTLGAFTTSVVTPGTPTTYVNNISGWMES